MGNFLSDLLQTNSQYQASPYQGGNPYSQAVLQEDLNNQAQIYAQQQMLAQQLQQNAAGLGPNPAQAQYQQNVQQNIANAQGLMASQRGLNPALAAKLGANTAAAANQQAAGQSAVLQAQQQLAAQQGLGNLYGQMQAGNLGAQQLYGQQNLGAAGINAAVASGNQKAAQAIVGGILGGAGSGAQMFGGGGGGGGASAAPAMAAAGAKGGMVEKHAAGGAIEGLPLGLPDPNGPGSFAGQWLNSASPGAGSEITSGFGSLGKGVGSMLRPGPQKPTVMAGGPGDTMGPAVDASQVSYVARGGRPSKNMKPGGEVPGKAKVSGDSLKNDTVPAMLSAKEIVLPRSVTMADDAPEKAKAFVAAILARENLKKRK